MAPCNCETLAFQPRQEREPEGFLRIFISELLADLKEIPLLPAEPRRSESALRWATLDTPFGPLFLSELAGRITSLCFLDGRGPGPMLAELKARLPTTPFQEAARALEPVRVFLVQAMGGEVPSFHLQRWNYF
jgi:hypothetical protein